MIVASGTTGFINIPLLASYLGKSTCSQLDLSIKPKPSLLIVWFNKFGSVVGGVRAKMKLLVPKTGFFGAQSGFPRKLKPGVRIQSRCQKRL